MENLMMYIALASIALSITLLFIVIRLNMRISKLFLGKEGRDLEGIVGDNNHKIASLENQQELLATQVKALGHDFKKSIQKIGIVRFNPFKETGGNQSFALALIDQEHNGVVISSLYSRERLNVFAKPIVEGQSSFQLSNEEEEALKQARKQA